MATLTAVESLPESIPGSHRWIAPWNEVAAFADNLFDEGSEKWVLVANDVNASVVTLIRKGRNRYLDPERYEAAFRVTQYEPKRGTVYVRRKR